MTGDSWWDAVYADGSAPWDIGRPQTAFVRLADAGEIASPVLDAGCGTGEHALMLAERGFAVTGVDLSATAIGLAREKAAKRGLAADFEVADVLALDRSEETFATVIDSGMFHAFDDDERPRYVHSLATILAAGGVLHLMCFSERTPGTVGPRRVTQAELRAAFTSAGGWDVERIQAAQFDVRADWAPRAANAWLARIVRRG